MYGSDHEKGRGYVCFISRSMRIRKYTTSKYLAFLVLDFTLACVAQSHHPQLHVHSCRKIRAPYILLFAADSIFEVIHICTCMRM